MSVTSHSLIAAASSPSNGTLPEEEYFSQFILPYHGFLFPFEKNPKETAKHFLGWCKKKRHFGLYLVAAYLLAVFVLQKVYMKHRKPFRLQIPLFLWNMALGVFSILCAWRALMDLFLILWDYGFHSSICSRLRYEFIDVWHLLFALSKFIELGDTFFIVLRKRPLIFLHWFHHTTVVVFEAYFLQEDFTLGRWMTAVNASVHAFMYPYFALRTLNVTVPSSVRKFITRVQLVQFLIFVLLNFPYIWFAKMMNIPCVMSTETTLVIQIIIWMQTFLFLRFYYEQYIRASAEKKLI